MFDGPMFNLEFSFLIIVKEVYKYNFTQTRNRYYIYGL